MGRDKQERASDGVGVDGPWTALPMRFLQSRACAELSPHGLKLFIDLMSMLKPNAGQNGDIWPSSDALIARGWTSAASMTAAMRELRAAGLVVITRRRRGRMCELIALTLWPLRCDQKKLDAVRLPHAVTDYRGHDGARLTPPTVDKPAVWRKARPSKPAAIGHSRSGCEKLVHPPQRERESVG